MKRVFVESTVVEETAAAGAEATRPNKAARVGANATVFTGADLATAWHSSFGAAWFVRNEVVGWISSLEAVGSSLPEALDAALAALGKTPEDMVQPKPQPLAGPAGALWR